MVLFAAAEHGIAEHYNYLAQVIAFRSKFRVQVSSVFVVFLETPSQLPSSPSQLLKVTVQSWRCCRLPPTIEITLRTKSAANILFQ